MMTSNTGHDDGDWPTLTDADIEEWLNLEGEHIRAERATAAGHGSEIGSPAYQTGFRDGIAEGILIATTVAADDFDRRFGRVLRAVRVSLQTVAITLACVAAAVAGAGLAVIL